MWKTYIKLDYFSHCIQHLTQYVKGRSWKTFRRNSCGKKNTSVSQKASTVTGRSYFQYLWSTRNYNDTQRIPKNHCKKDSLGETWAKHLGRFFISRMSNNHIFKCSNLLVNKEININTTISIILLPLVWIKYLCDKKESLNFYKLHMTTHLTHWESLNFTHMHTHTHTHTQSHMHTYTYTHTESFKVKMW